MHREARIIITNQYICDFLTSNQGHRFKECHQPEGIKQQILLLVLLKSQDHALKASYNIENTAITHVFKKTQTFSCSSTSHVSKQKGNTEEAKARMKLLIHEQRSALKRFTTPTAS
jgi:hypothetical protein